MAFSWLSGSDDVAELISKRNYTRAAKVLRGLLAKDPANTSVRQQLADVLALDGKLYEAVELLWKLADEYATSGFVGKGIAVLKKVQRLDPSLTKVEEKLASLVKEKDAESSLRYNLRAGAMRRRAELETAPTPTPKPEPLPAPPPSRGLPDSGPSPFVVDFGADDAEEAPAETVSETAPRSLHPLGEEAAQGMVASPLFSDFSAEELVEVIKGLELLTYEAGDVIVAEGAPGDSLFVLTTGTVKAFVKDPDGHYHKVREMYEGAFFGEVSILTGKPRSATITAATPCELLALDRTSLDAITERQPNVLTILRHFCEARLGSADEVQIRTGHAPPGPSRGSTPA
ncbi:MAG: cyclic nucleotide-binding domain-containing protein [Deltaproteobacteria bacterium]|nr:cyclic nucleotide-binding domain-containing protein [Deltaproteobacteria bacterium]